jgi:prepilin-type processing-associated H-X9-DG protein/prepilin-type N-terminal cleavage/methylation domain-containing protein
MSSQRTRAFTLVELLVVITIVAILVVLLMPGLTSAWQSAQATRCKRNLNTLYSAYSVWKADQERQGRDPRLLQVPGDMSSGWRYALSKYCEDQQTVFACESRLIRWQDLTGGNRGGTGWENSEPDSVATPGDVSPNPEFVDNGPSASEGINPLNIPYADEDYGFTFDVYLQKGAIEGNTSVNGEGFSEPHPYGQFIRSLPLGNSPYVRKTNISPYKVRYECDDCGIGITGDADICVEINYNMDGVPVSFTDVRGSGAGTQSAMWRYIYDFRVCGQVVVQRWQTHYGETFDLSNLKRPQPTLKPGGPIDADTGGGGGGPTGGGTDGGGSRFDLFRRPLPGDYGLNRGVYEAVYSTGARAILYPDAKMFFMLDFPKAVADFTPGSADIAEWYTFFSRTKEEWEANKGPKVEPGTPWQYYQALRHFGGANVLFVDGHVELVEPDQLTVKDPKDPTKPNPLWCSQSR